MNCMILEKLHVSRCQFCNQPIKDIFNVYDLISIIPLLDKYLRQKKIVKDIYRFTMENTAIPPAYFKTGSV